MLTSQRVLLIPMIALLQGCGGGMLVDDGLGPEAIVAVASGDLASNGAGFADGAGALALEGQTVTIRLAEVSNSGSDVPIEIRLVDATLTLEEGWLLTGAGDGALDLDGKTLIFTEGEASMDSLTFETERLGMDLSNGVRATLTSRGEGTETTGFYILGTETDPDTLALQSDQAFYVGRVDVTGYATDDGLPFSDSTSIMTGELRITTDFGAGTVVGSVEKGTVVLSSDGGDLFGTFDASFDETPIVQNGFATALSVDACFEADVCGASENEIGGLFYGEDGEVIAGLVTIDQDFLVGPAEVPINMQGVGVFDASIEDVED